MKWLSRSFHASSVGLIYLRIQLLIFNIPFEGGDTDAASKALLGVGSDGVKQYFLILVSLYLLKLQNPSKPY